ncbi:MAG: dUTP diphosphatase [Bacilli bacterium]
MKFIDLSPLFEKQKELDENIAKNHHVTYESTRNKRSLALLVEIGEFANATRTFKYWSNKSSLPKEVVLDEYADGLHFFLSLGIDANIKTTIVELVEVEMTPTDIFLKLYDDITKFFSSRNEDDYLNAFKTFLSLLYPLGLTIEELEVAYYHKLQENYHRQETNY